LNIAFSLKNQVRIILSFFSYQYIARQCENQDFISKDSVRKNRIKYPEGIEKLIGYSKKNIMKGKI
jgi:hypothetical protein